MKTLTSHSLDETAKIASDWLQELERKQADAEEATLIGLSGHLGAGKTAFVKEIAKRLGIKEEVTSPTFIIMKAYEIDDPRWHRLIHIDAYRLEKREELAGLDWEAVMADPHNLILMEWPENVGISPNDRGAHLRFEIKEGAHTISFE